MALIYKGDGIAAINDAVAGHIPARDLSDEEVQDIAKRWGLSLAETEGLLMKHKLYALAPKQGKAELAKRQEMKEE
jgi:hypothetical protein